MLRSLHIENIAVIRRVDLDFGNGFSVLTGETGAGKSIIIDSINLLLGNRVSREIIRTGADTATVSAVTKKYLSAAQSEGGVMFASMELPKSFVLYKERGKSYRICFSQLSTSALAGRMEMKNDQ